MKIPPLLQDEQLRLNDLRAHFILDSAEEESFNEILAIAAHICDCPTALISMVDVNRQWFKSSINMPHTELPRDSSFCGHAVAQDEIFIIEDATADERFHDNPNVTGDMNIRFYAGAQIVSKKGFNLGTVCVIDNKPKSITEDQKEILKKIASQVSHMIEVRTQHIQAQQLALAEKTETLNDIINFIPFFIESSFPKIIFNATDYSILDVNEAALKLYGYHREEILQLTALDLKANKNKEIRARWMDKIESGTLPVTVHSRHQKKDGKQVDVSLTIIGFEYQGHNARLADITDLTNKKVLEKKIRNIKESSEKKILSAAQKAKQKEKDNITDALRENINQILACTNMFLSIASQNEEMRLELIQKSQKNIQLAIEEIKNLYRSSEESFEDNFLKESIDQIILKHELLRSFKIHFSLDGKEKFASEKIRMVLYKIIEEYLDGALKGKGTKNIWLSVNFDATIELIIKNDNKSSDSKKRKLYMQKLSEELKKIDGTADLFENGNSSSTLHICVPNPELMNLPMILTENEFAN